MDTVHLSETEYYGLKARLRRWRSSWSEDWIEDCLQDALLLALKTWDGRSKFGTWIYRCAGWTSTDRLRDCYGRSGNRKLAREIQAPELLFESLIDPEFGPAEVAERQDEIWRAREIAGTLSPRMRQVIESKVLGLTHQEVAEQMGVAPGTVGQHLHLMRKRLGHGLLRRESR